MTRVPIEPLEGKGGSHSSSDFNERARAPIVPTLAESNE